jgi:hypothetical protein
MPLNQRWRKVLRIIAIATGIFVFAAFTFLQIQQHILRWRAEQLLSDIRELQLGKSTWADAQKIMTRWGAWGHYDGSCTQERCSYKIALNGFDCETCTYRFLEIVTALATRDASINADIEVINGAIWGKDFALRVLVFENVFHLFDIEGGYILTASARTVWRTADFNRYYSMDHPDYVVHHPGGCEGCVSVYSRFTPFVAPDQARDLMDFNLACLTRLLQCKGRSDIMPRVGRQVKSEEQQLEVLRATNPGYTYQNPSPELLGRDRANIVIAEVISTRAEQDPIGPTPLTSFRLDQRLKRAIFWEPLHLEEAYAKRKLTSGGKDNEGAVILPGRKVILAFDTPYRISRQHPMDLGDYEVLPLTEENLAAICKGIALDIFPESTAPSVFP